MRKKIALIAVLLGVALLTLTGCFTKSSRRFIEGKARINGATNEDVDSLYFEEEYKIKPLNFTYLSSFRDPETGTSGVAFKDETSGKTII